MDQPNTEPRLDTYPNAELGVMWECLNSVYFTDEAGMDEHRRLLLLYRRRLAKAHDVEPGDIECGTLEHYNLIRKKQNRRRLETAA